MDLAGEVHHARKAGQGDLAFVIVVAKGNPQLVGDRPLLHAADEQVHVFLLKEAGKLQRVGVVDQHRALVAKLAQPLVVVAIAGLRTGQHGLHSQGPQGADEGERLERPAHIDRPAAAFEVCAAAPQFGHDGGNLAANQFLGPRAHRRVGEEIGHVVEGLGHVLDAKVRNANERDAIFLLHRLCQVDHRAGALHDVQLRAVGPADGVDASVAGERGDNVDADPPVIIADHPGFAGEIEIAEDVDASRADVVGRPGSNEPGQAVAGRPIAVLLRAAEALAMDGQGGNALLRLDPPANLLDVVADQADETGGIDERRAGMIAVDQLAQRRIELLLAAVDHVALAKVGRETHAVQFRSGGERAADVPGVRRAARRAVDEVQRVGDRIEDDARAAEDARPLAYRSRQALLFAGHGERLRAFLVDLRFAGLEDVDHEQGTRDWEMERAPLAVSRGALARFGIGKGFT